MKHLDYKWLLKFINNRVNIYYEWQLGTILLGKKRIRHSDCKGTTVKSEPFSTISSCLFLLISKKQREFYEEKSPFKK